MSGGEIQCADKTSIPKFERKNWGRVERKVNGGRDIVKRIFFSGADDDDDDYIYSIALYLKAQLC